MKKTFLHGLIKLVPLALIATSLLAINGCKDDPDKYETPEATITPEPKDNTFIFDQNEGSQNLTLNTNRKWKITTSGESWFTITPTEGDKGEHVISVTVLANEGEAREGQFTITASSKKFTFNVQQKSQEGKTIEYTPLSVIQEKAKGLDQNGKTIDEEIAIRAVVTTHFEAKQFPFAAYHHIQDAEGNAIVLTLKKGSGDPIPFGTQVTAKLKGCKLSNYNGTVQIEVERGNITLTDNMPIEPKDITLEEVLAGGHANQYVRIKGLQFKNYKNVLYFDGTYSSKRHIVENSKGTTTSLEIWKTCVWGNENVPEGSGTFTGVVTINISKGKTYYNLRPTQKTDIAFNEKRFGESGGGDDPIKPTEFDGGIKAIVDMFNAGKTEIETTTTLKGVIINNPTGNAVSNKSVIISDSKAGIMLFLTDKGVTEKQFQVGDNVEVTLQAGTKMQRYNKGALQIAPKHADLKKVEKTHTIEPIEVSFADLMTDKIKGELENRLITVKGVQFVTAGGAFAGDKTSYLPIQENASSKATNEFNLPSVASSSKKFNKLGISTIPEGNGSITGVATLSFFKNKFVCNIWARTSNDIQLTNPRK